MISDLHTKGFWKDISNQRIVLDALAKRLNITDQEDWYKVTRKVFVQNGAGGLLQKYSGSPSKLLAAIYPEYPYQLLSFHFQYTTGI